MYLSNNLMPRIVLFGMHLIRMLCIGVGMAATLAVGVSPAVATREIPLPDGAVLSQTGSGPVLAGDSVVWVAKDGLHSAVRSRGIVGGPVRTLLELPDLPAADNRAYAEYVIRYEGDRLNISQNILTCMDACFHASGPNFVSHGQWVGPADGPLTPVEDYCTQLVGPDFVLTGYVDVPLLSPSRCPSGPPTITGTAGSSGIVRTYPDLQAVAGHYAATWTITGTIQHSSSTIRVIDWRTGLDRAVVSQTTTPFTIFTALSRDGGMIVTDETASQRYYIDPAHPTLANPLDIPNHSYALTLAGDRVAWVTDSDGDQTEVGLTQVGEQAVVVSRAPAAQTASYNLRDIDFDGSHLTWADTKCGVTSIVVWDTATARPPLGWKCGRPALAVAPRLIVHGKSASGRALAVRLRCPVSATRPCSGHAIWMTGEGFGISKVDLPFSIPPGHTRKLPASTGLRWKRFPRGHTRTVLVTVQLDGAPLPKAIHRHIRVTRR